MSKLSDRFSSLHSTTSTFQRKEQNKVANKAKQQGNRNAKLQSTRGLQEKSKSQTDKPRGPAGKAVKGYSTVYLKFLKLVILFEFQGKLSR